MLRRKTDPKEIENKPTKDVWDIFFGFSGLLAVFATLGVAIIAYRQGTQVEILAASSAESIAHEQVTNELLKQTRELSNQLVLANKNGEIAVALAKTNGQITHDNNENNIRGNLAMTSLVQATTKSIASDDADIRRSQEFQNLIKDISKPETSTLALLTLWKLYDKPKDHYIVVAAAFAVARDNPEVIYDLRRLPREVQPIVAEMKKREPDLKTRAAIQAYEDASRPVHEVNALINSLPELVERNGYKDNPDLKTLISFVQNDPQMSRKAVEQAAKRENSDAQVFLYVLYLAKPGVQGKKHLASFLKNMQTSTDRFYTSASILYRGDFGKDDWANIVNTTISANARDHGNKYPFRDICKVLRAPNLINYYGSQLSTNAVTNQIIDLAYHAVKNSAYSARDRFDALMVYSSWNPEGALVTASEVLSGDGRDEDFATWLKLFVDQDTSSDTNGDAGARKRLQVVWKAQMAPGFEESPQKWKEWALGPQAQALQTFRYQRSVSK